MSAVQPPRRPLPPEEAPTAVGSPPRQPYPRAYREAAAPPYGQPAPGYGNEYGAPLPPEDPRWWERGWLSEALAALAALIVGFVVGLLVGESSSTKNTTNGAAPARTVTVKGPTHTTTVTHVVVHTLTHTVTTAAPSSGTEGSAGSGGGSSGGGRTYSGSGNSSVGTITVAHQSMLHWRSSGGFAIKNSPEDEHSLGFNSGASSGEVPVEPGTYHKVTVTAPGEWSLTISPG